MGKKEDELIQKLAAEAARLAKEVSELKKLDLDSILTSGRSRKTTEDDGTPRQRTPSKREVTPDWVLAWNRQNARHGEVKKIVTTTDTYHEATGIVTSKTELTNPMLTTNYKRNLKTGEVEEQITSAGLPEHLRLDVAHDPIERPVLWPRPTTDAVPPRELARWKSGPGASEHAKRLEKWLAENPGNPLENREEGPTKPVRKQMLRMNKVWKYRNFKKCNNCELYDTWEARTQPYSDGVRIVHAEIWCHTCGAVEFEVSNSSPSHIGSWAPPKESSKEAAKRIELHSYRRERTIFSLVQSPKTAAQLTVWFREVEKYEGVDFVMIEIMLQKMRKQGRVVLESDGRWWEREDHEFEHPEKYKH